MTTPHTDRPARRPVSRASWNALVDGISFAAFVLLTSTGVLLRWTLPPGSGRRTTVFGLDRHEWGTLHFWMAIALLAALSLHLALHWRFIANVVRGRARTGSWKRAAIGVFGLIALLALALAPFFAPVEESARGGGERRGMHRGMDAR
ncbi:MAG: hypothetical protein DCC71_17320 [Proteobacteria bacterium]|nr:MAG: hypothetical protein DCC71_17320 [Pseudomonadota bacterium]